ncbi:hypothetical protein ACLH0K_16855 [Arthrobacter sp. MPF02]|uniref:hypothetical protein n=1 Tax=Arthrobacter sp. MPF02 TaxID=3388492 RepID=UPI003984CD83
MQDQSLVLDRQITEEQKKLANLQRQKKINKDAVAAQTLVVNSLTAKLGDIQKQIAAIDGTKALGGCTVGLALSGISQITEISPDPPSLCPKCPPRFRGPHTKLP